VQQLLRPELLGVLDDEIDNDRLAASGQEDAAELGRGSHVLPGRPGLVCRRAKSPHSVLHDR
jgi:hypothetical protein